MLSIQKTVDSLKMLLLGNKAVPSLPEAIENAQIQIYDAQTELDYLDTLLKIAHEDKRRALLQGQKLIQAAVEADKRAIELERAAHQQQLEQLEANYQYRREALLQQLEQLNVLKEATVKDVQTEFSSLVGDANSRANIAARELARLQSLLGDTEEQ